MGGPDASFVQSPLAVLWWVSWAGRCLGPCFTCVRDCESAFRDGFFLFLFFVFVGMFCLFRAALLSASPGGVLALGWPKTKRDDWKGGFPFGDAPPSRALLANCARVCPLIFEP